MLKSGNGNGNGNGKCYYGNPANTAVKGFDLVGELTFGKIITFLVILLYTYDWLFSFRKLSKFNTCST